MTINLSIPTVHPMVVIGVVYAIGYAVYANVKYARVLSGDYSGCKDDAYMGCIFIPLLWPVLALWFLITSPARVLAKRAVRARY